MSRQQRPPQIRPIEVLNRRTGKKETRYELIADAGINPETGRRAQVRRRFTAEKDAKEALAKLQTGVADGTHVAKSGFTVEDACVAWLNGRHEIKPTTRAAYEHALAPLRDRHGNDKLQELTKEKLDALVTDLTAGKFPGQRKGWTTNSINPMLNIISAVLTEQVALGRAVRDHAALVKRSKRPKRKLTTFTERQADKMLKHARGHRLEHAWHLALYGARRGEILGLKWINVNLTDQTIGEGEDALPPRHVRISETRVAVNGKAIDQDDTKTDDSARDLPLTPALIAVLKRAQTRQKAEYLKAGGKYQDSGHVVCNELGQPYHPDSLSGWWKDACALANVPSIRLHDARHSCGSIMHNQGVPLAVISQWLGHSDPAFTLRTYVHPDKDGLAAAAAVMGRVVTSS
ncbi:MAG: site-specific integrase [Actinomycetota bacterium]|nr:site-specific integrase [Actinomycetota bacterium]